MTEQTDSYEKALASCEKRRKENNIALAMDVGGPRNLVSIFTLHPDIRQTSTHMAVIGPPAVNLLLQRFLQQGRREEVLQLIEFIQDHDWFPAARGFNPNYALKNLNEKIEHMLDPVFVDLVHGLSIANRIPCFFEPRAIVLSNFLQMKKLGEIYAHCYPDRSDQFLRS